MGSQASQGGSLAASERAEFGHEGDEGGGGLFADALDGDQDFDGAGDGLALGGQSLDVGVDSLDLLVEACEERVKVSMSGLGARGEAAVGVGEAILDEITPGEDESLQAQALAISGLPAREFGVAIFGVSEERLGVDAVGFAERSKGSDEGLDLTGVGAMGADAGVEQGGEQAALIAAGGFAYDETSRVEFGGELH